MLLASYHDPLSSSLDANAYRIVHAGQVGSNVGDTVVATAQQVITNGLEDVVEGGGVVVQLQGKRKSKANKGEVVERDTGAPPDGMEQGMEKGKTNSSHQHPDMHACMTLTCLPP
jgi:hypothetical protein